MSKKLAEAFIVDYNADFGLQKFLHNMEKKKFYYIATGNLFVIVGYLMVQLL